MEALIRWNSDTLGFVSPSEFIPITGDNGFINEIGEFVFREACQQIKEIHGNGYPDLSVNINVSPLQLNREFPMKVQQILSEVNLAPHYVELEITETSIMRNIVENVMILNELKELGVRITIDDFGTGYSSLVYLKKLPLDTLKIDQTFVRDMLENPNDKDIVHMVLRLAESFELQVIAE